MKSKWLFIFVLILFMAMGSEVFAKEEVWKNKKERFSDWKKVIVVELTSPSKISEDILLRNIVAEEWADVLSKIFSFNFMQKISWSEALKYLSEKDATLNWAQLWASDQEEFFRKAAPLWDDYADGILISSIQNYNNEVIWKTKKRSKLSSVLGVGASIPVGGHGEIVGQVGQTVGAMGGQGGKEVTLSSIQGEFSLVRMDGTRAWIYRSTLVEEDEESDQFMKKFFRRIGNQIPLKK